MTRGTRTLLALLAPIVGAGCQESALSAPEQSGPRRGSDPRTAPIVSEINDWILQGYIVGAEILIIEYGDTVLHHATGWLDRERNIRMAENTIFRIYSNSKPVLGTAVLMLQEHGRLSLSDPVADYLPSFDNEVSRGITLRHLITHTSGLDYRAYFFNYDNLRDLADAIGAEGPSLPVGDQFQYSDRGSAVLGAVVAEVTGMPVEEFIRDSVLVPLGMYDTFANLSDDDPWRRRVSSSYAWDGQQCYKYWDNTLPQVERYFRPYGGLYSTVTDYLRFMTMWMDEGSYGATRFLSPRTVREALIPTSLSLAAGLPYGYHWQVPALGEPLPVFGHGGFAGTYAWADPARGLVVAYFIQCVASPVAAEAAIVRVVEEALY